MEKKTTEYDLNLSVNLKVFRIRHGIGAHEMSEHLCMSKSNYYKVEKGERKLTYGQLMKVVEKTKITPEEFLNLCNIPKDQDHQNYLVGKLVEKLILIKEGQEKTENINFSADELEFMEKVKLNFKRQNQKKVG